MGRPAHPAYGQRTVPRTGGRSRRTEDRYHGYRWTKLARAIRRRDPVCWVPGCGRATDAADHITPVYAGMPDAEFYDPANLRGSCQGHNLMRGLDAAKVEREGRFFNRTQNARLRRDDLSPRSTSVVTGDYTRRPA